MLGFVAAAPQFTVSSSSDKRSCTKTIRITDHGQGIAEGIRDRIFTPFFSTREDSTGLGLPIVKQLLNHHGGTITFPDPGTTGCVVEITLPLPASPREATVGGLDA